ncbi:MULTISPECIES: FAD-binding oxidoreductase [Synechococcaceae]|uniref:FAD-binding oxidoreductase n=1 Tax=Synechococcaceae TaxID=1890426 RepID=UPI000A7DB5C9|nr:MULTISPECIES: FAD-binding oxidoreductase [Synechococcaceae]MCT4365593.1 FAD-binding oxidoreductase [Candidatus Regnicoccus frigidus MAG-AL1]MCT4368659.1 FAD-binding oxidoreductase [Candidatus Regnicoccus frigidus MAG-AL2]TWB96602.1 FAD/FMN-containing dehydrogenase [Synechococcus sp. Ace-Pa]
MSVKPALNPFPEGLPEDLPAAATAAQLAAIETELSEASGATGSGPKLVHDGPELARLSRDCFDYSPVLQPLLSGRLAQLVVKASRLEEVLAVAKACSRQGVPLTLRGSGTGNYGQCVPLAGGVVLDLSGLNRMRQLEASSGIVTAEAGCLLADLDRQLSVSGRSLRLAPSTWRSATVAGFIAGGSGGIGSLRWGFLRDPGNLIGLELVTLEAEPRLLQLDGRASRPINHAYGTNGIITAVRLPTAAAVNWQQLVVEFSHWERALEAARMLPGTALLLHSLCLLEEAVARQMPAIGGQGAGGCPAARGHRLLLLAAPDTLEILPHLLADLGGTLIWQAPEQGQRGLPLRELCWNHTTLHARAHDPGWTYLQMLLPQPEAPFLSALKQRWGEDLLWHLEGVRQQGSQRLAALPLVRWRGAESLAELIAEVHQNGGLLFNPHVFNVEDGGLGVVDADQVSAKHCYDPAGLLNPGKLRGWAERKR